VYPRVIAFASDPTLPKRQPAISALLGDDVQPGAGGPTEFGRKSVREHLHFLDGANRHGGDRRLTAPTFIVVRAVNHECGSTSGTNAGDEVRRVDKEIAGALALAEGRIEERQRCNLAAKDRRLVDL